MRCHACGRENPSGFRFCGYCTAPLEDAASAAEERKVVTVLFCDLVGFTARSDSADPEDVRERIRPYHARVRTEIERFGGTVEKFVGDAVMAVFGAPVAHEDDAERAVHAGLRVLEAIDELNEATPDLELSVRVGINTGEAVVALGARPEEGEGIVTGDVVNTASRLQSAAPVAGIAVGELTYRHTKDVFDYGELEPVSVKGKAEPLRIWQARSARARFGTDVTRTHSTPFVGRELEQKLLQDTYARCVRDSSVHLVTIVGEPGAGKSRLVAELFRYVDAQAGLVTWRQGRCLPYGDGISLWALGEIVKAHAGILESDAPEQAARKLEAAVADGLEEREWVLARLAPLVGAEAEAAGREESFTAWRRFLESLAAERPAVLVFEDLHWADESLLAFLEHMVEWSQGVAVLLVCTARPELFERHAGWGAGVRNATTINLAPLSDEETARLVDGLVDFAEVPAEAQALVLEHAGGNPLYAEEFVRMLKDSGLLVRDDTTVALAPGPRLPSPESVQALIAARLDTLPAHRKTLLQNASVIGKVFWASAVAELEHRDQGSVRNDLHQLSRQEFVRPARRSSMEGESEYAFSHVLVRDVCYGQILRLARAAKHIRAAEWIERRAGERAEDLADVIAHHYSEALELGRAAGRPDDEELETQARRFLLLAGDRALPLDVSRAEAHYARALALAPAGHPERPAILERWAMAAQQAGRLPEAATPLEEAVAGFRDQGDALQAGRALVALSILLGQLGDARKDRVRAEGLTLLEACPPGPELVDAYVREARAKSTQSAHREAIAAADRALALAARLRLPEPGAALGVRGASRAELGDAAGVDEMRRALAVVLAYGRARDAAWLHVALAEAAEAYEGPEAALRAARAGIEFCEQRGIAEFAFAIAGESLVPLVERGEWDEVLALAESLAARVEAGAPRIGLPFARAARARVLAERGQVDQACEHAEWLVATTRDSGASAVVQAFAAAARARCAAGDHAQAAALVDELEQAPHVREYVKYPSFLPELVRTALACAEPALAERLTGGVEPLTPLHAHALHAVRAQLAEASGDREHAAELYDESAERWRRFGNVHELGHALLGQARCLLVHDRPAAESALREAREIFASLRAQPLLAEAEALLQHASPLPS